MAFYTTERWVDLVVAHQAVSHMRKDHLTDRIRLLQSRVTSGTRMRLPVSGSGLGRSEIFLRLDRLGDEGRYRRSEPDVKLMVEFRHGQLARFFDRSLHSGMTGYAKLRFGQEVIGGGCAAGRGAMTRDTRNLLREMDAMRKLRACRNGKKPQDDGEPPSCKRQLPCVICQTLFPPSSLTSRLPSFITRMPVGRPQTSRLPGSILQPVRKSSGGPAGLPPLNGTNTTE